MAQTSMRIGTLARTTGLSTSALRYYEEAGLLGPAGRTQAGYRVFGPDAIGRIEFLQRAKALGLSLSEIRELISSPESDGSADRERVRHLVAHKLAEARSRIGELRTLESELQSLYVRLLRQPDAICGHVGDCACWLPTAEEVKVMAEEVTCCGELCCPECSCRQGEPCDCPDCPCCLD